MSAMLVVAFLLFILYIYQFNVCLHCKIINHALSLSLFSVCGRFVVVVVGGGVAMCCILLSFTLVFINAQN